MHERVDWSEREEHMFLKHGVTTSEAGEVIEDPMRVWIEPDYNSISGQSIRVIGYSHTARRILTIILVRDEGKLWGGTGFPSNGRDCNIYHGKDGDHEQDL